MQAAPSYTAVAARQTLQRPTVVAQPAAPQKIEWGPSVRSYVQRAFEAGNTVPGIDAQAMQEKLKFIITKATEAGNLDSTDWSTYPLPQHLIKAEREQAALFGGQDAMYANTNVNAFDGNAVLGFGVSRKRKSFDDVEMTDAAPRETTPPWKKQNTKSTLEDRMTGKTKTKDKKQKKLESFRVEGLNTDADVLRKRRQRFGHVTTPEPSPFLSSRDESPATVGNEGPLVGTCQTLEKSYFRLTAPPAPHTVRPFPVLEKALEHIRRKWKKEHNYRYACDQLKSMRQDLTVQHIKNELTVKVYEAHARIALEMKDLGEYNQCQTQLRALYKLKLGGNPEEFLAYRILYFIYTCNRTNMNDVLADLTPADKKMSGVQHALQVRAALASGNYHKFFRLYDDTPFMGGYLLDMFVERERLAAMAIICRTFKPDVSVRFLADELAFHGDDESDPADADAGSRQCLDFLCQHASDQLIERKGDDVRFLSGKAGTVFEAAKAAAFRVVDIKGQI